jgi:hypothetical protein
MRRILVGFIVVGLIGGMALQAEAGKKKKKKPRPAPAPVAVDVTFYLNGGCGQDEVLVLNTTNTPSDSGCGNVFYGALGEATLATPQEAVAAQGVPLTLDASKHLTGVVTVTSFTFNELGPDVIGIGQTTLKATLTATSGGEEIVVGEISETYTVTPAQQHYPIEFDVELDPALNLKVLDSLTLSLMNEGNSAFHGYYRGDGSTTLKLGSFSTP